MELTGHFENGVIVLDGGTPLPDGTRVGISSNEPAIHHQPRLTPEDLHEVLSGDEVLSVIAAREPLLSLLEPHPGPRVRIPSPLVPSDRPGSISHTPEEIRAFLNADD